jgi:hypothetical protein
MLLSTRNRYLFGQTGLQGCANGMGAGYQSGTVLGVLGDSDANTTAAMEILTAFPFPPNPIRNQIHQDTNGGVYAWSGDSWTMSGKSILDDAKAYLQSLS